MPNKMVLTDIDDTILNCSDPLQAFYIEKTGHKPIAKLRDMHYMHHAFDIPKNSEFPEIMSFWESPIFGELQPEPCAKIVLPELFGKGYTFGAISSCWNTPITRRLRWSNLNKHFPGYFSDMDTHLVYPESKYNALSFYNPVNCVWVEDNLSDAIIGADLGFRTFLLDRPHNRKIGVKTRAPLTRVRCWHEIYKLLETEK